jgi:zinc protease
MPGFPMRAALLRVVLSGCLLVLSFGFASAIEIKQVTSPGGITAWLVESNTVPLIAMDFSFEGPCRQRRHGKFHHRHDG